MFFFIPSNAIYTVRNEYLDYGYKNICVVFRGSNCKGYYTCMIKEYV